MLPKRAPYETWAVIACDQFTSQPEYWENVRETVGDNPSTLNLILPEAYLGTDDEDKMAEKINYTMTRYIDEGEFETYEDSMIYVERTLLNGDIRKGLIGKADLEAYDYTKGAVSDIRATEETDVNRISPRVHVRRQASIELPHVLMLCDDNEKVLIEPLSAIRDTLPLLYDFDLMEGGGHIRGWLVNGKVLEEFNERLAEYSENIPEKYKDLDGMPMTFATGDGNHSLATAKECWEEYKAAHPNEDLADDPRRYALVELENIHDDALKFEPIHRIITGTDGEALLEALGDGWCAEGGYPVTWYMKDKSGTVFLDPKKSELAVGVLQEFLDEYLEENDGELDYIHGDDTLRDLAEDDDAIGFLLPAMEKGQLFRGVIADGALPRKTFSMGHATEKRYYIEARELTG